MSDLNYQQMPEEQLRTLANGNVTDTRALNELGMRNFTGGNLRVAFNYFRRSANRNDSLGNLIQVICSKGA